jgi:hypothetical protein
MPKIVFPLALMAALTFGGLQADAAVKQSQPIEPSAHSLSQQSVTAPAAELDQLAGCGPRGYGYGYPSYYRSYRPSYYGGYGGYYGRPSYYGGYYGSPGFYGGYPGYYGRSGVGLYIGF